jgi:hypothetical protein
MKLQLLVSIFLLLFPIYNHATIGLISKNSALVTDGAFAFGVGASLYGVSLIKVKKSPHLSAHIGFASILVGTSGIILLNERNNNTYELINLSSQDMDLLVEEGFTKEALIQYNLELNKQRLKPEFSVDDISQSSIKIIEHLLFWQ